MGGQRHAPPALSSEKKKPVPIEEEAGWNPGTVWTGAKNLAFTEIRSPDRPARSEALSRPSCLCSEVHTKHRKALYEQKVEFNNDKS